MKIVREGRGKAFSMSSWEHAVPLDPTLRLPIVKYSLLFDVPPNIRAELDDEEKGLLERITTTHLHSRRDAMKRLPWLVGR